MTWIRPVAIGLGAAAAGVAVATQTHDVAKRLATASGERAWDRQYDGTDRGSMEYFGSSAIYADLGALGLASAGVAMLTKHSLATQATGAGTLVAAAALMGAGIGATRGFSAGEHASDEKHGVNIAEQTTRVMRNFDHDGDGVLALQDDSFPETLYQYEFQVPREGFTPETKFLSIEKFLTAADANDDAVVSRKEVASKLSSYDDNGNGLLSADDITRLADDGLEPAAARSSIAEFDPWGAYVPVAW